MNVAMELKQAQQEIINLRNALTIVANKADALAEEKNQMLCTIAVLVDRLGGKALIGRQDSAFITAWRDGKTVLTAEVSTDGPYAVTFTIRHVEGQDVAEKELHADDTAGLEAGAQASATEQAGNSGI